MKKTSLSLTLALLAATLLPVAAAVVARIIGIAAMQICAGGIPALAIALRQR